MSGGGGNLSRPRTCGLVEVVELFTDMKNPPRWAGVSGTNYPTANVHSRGHLVKFFDAFFTISINPTSEHRIKHKHQRGL